MLALALTVLAACGPELPADPPRLALPPYLYAVTGEALDVYRDNLVLSYQANGAPYDFTFSGVSGSLGASKWTHTPSAAGTSTLGVFVDVDGVPMDAETTTLRVSDGVVGTTKIVLVGDSLTANTVYPPALDSQLGAQVTFLGTQVASGTNHEGNSGKTFCWFADNDLSPMTSAANVLDIPAYFTAIGATPDVMVWMLGINGGFTDPLELYENWAITEIACANELFAAVDAVAPSIVHGVVLVTPGDKEDAPYFSTYVAPANSEWTWRRKNHREVEMWIAEWGTSADEAGGIYLIPANLSIDRVDGYTNNAVHPNTTGYTQIANIVRAWLAWVR